MSEVTYFHTKDGFLCLTKVIALYDRKVIGWSDMTEKNAPVPEGTQN